MIVRHFLHWSRTASVAERAEATSALGHAYLETEFTPGERAAAEGALIALLDDPSPSVRAALAQAMARSELTPPTIVHTLAADLPEVVPLPVEFAQLPMAHPRWLPPPRFLCEAIHRSFRRVQIECHAPLLISSNAWPE